MQSQTKHFLRIVFMYYFHCCKCSLGNARNILCYGIHLLPSLSTNLFQSRKIELPKHIHHRKKLKKSQNISQCSAWIPFMQTLFHLLICIVWILEYWTIFSLFIKVCNLFILTRLLILRKYDRFWLMWLRCDWLYDNCCTSMILWFSHVF